MDGGRLAFSRVIARTLDVSAGLRLTFQSLPAYEAVVSYSRSLVLFSRASLLRSVWSAGGKNHAVFRLGDQGHLCKQAVRWQTVLSRKSGVLEWTWRNRFTPSTGTVINLISGGFCVAARMTRRGMRFDSELSGGVRRVSGTFPSKSRTKKPTCQYMTSLEERSGRDTIFAFFPFGPSHWSMRAHAYRHGGSLLCIDVSVARAYSEP